MSVLIYMPSDRGIIKKSAFESLTYARLLANKTDDQVCAVGFNVQDYTEVKDAGADKIYDVRSKVLEVFDICNYAHALLEIVKKENTKTIVFGTQLHSKSIASYLSVRLNSEYVSNVMSLPLQMDPYEVMRCCYSGKAESSVEINTPIKIIGIVANVFIPRKFDVTTEVITIQLEELPNPIPVVVGREESDSKISISDANIVVSGGRGLKSPENWEILEDLASTIGGALACSRAVSDLGWRPHNEHVGQTGRPVAPNIYIAIGISGAIQHIAGISNSRIKIVINNDPEAPFFKVADYGVVGDAMEIVPRLTQKLKAISQTVL